MIWYRVQADDGRGPWRPGWSHVWIDDAAPVGRLSETVMDLVGGIEALRRLPAGRHYGCACVSRDALREWFTTAERRTLGRLGFYPVAVAVDGVIAASPWQALTWRRQPYALGSPGVRRVAWAESMKGGS